MACTREGVCVCVCGGGGSGGRGGSRRGSAIGCTREVVGGCGGGNGRGSALAVRGSTLAVGRESTLAVRARHILANDGRGGEREGGGGGLPGEGS